MTIAALIRAGQLCNTCTRECRDAEAIQIECVECGGLGCDKCNDGYMTIEGCKQQQCRGLVETIALLDLFDKGLTPVAGGMLDQSASFVSAARFFNRVENRIKNDG